MREETERLVKEALERKTLTVKQGKTRIDSKCRKCGALNRVSAAQGQVRVPYMCKDAARNKGHSDNGQRDAKCPLLTQSALGERDGPIV